MGQLDLSPYLMSIIAIGIALVALSVAVFSHLRREKGGRRQTITNGDLLDELRHLRTEFDARFGAKFSNFVFGPDEASAFFYALSNSLDRFNDYGISGAGEDTDIDPIREAQGYVVIVQLILSWAQASGHDGIKARAEEFLDAAKSTLEKAKAT